MKIKFPILIQYPKQLESLFEYLDSKGIRWCSGKSLIKNNIFKLVPSTINPLWIFYDNNRGVSYWRVVKEEELDIKYVLDRVYYTPREVEFED